MISQLRQTLFYQAQHLQDFQYWFGGELAEMVFNWIDEGILPNPQLWMDNMFPYEGPPPPANMAVRQSLQRWFHCNPKQVLKSILEGAVCDNSAPVRSKRYKMTKEWQQLMKNSPPSFRPVNRGNIYNFLRRPEAVMRPVKAREVQYTDVGEFRAAGPDAVNVSDWQEVPPVVRAVFYNLVLANNGFCARALQHRAVFIRNIDEEYSSFFEYVAVPNAAVRQLHKILLMRLKEEMEVHSLRRLNLMIIASLLRSKTPFMMVKVGFYRAYALLKQDAVYEILHRAGATMLADYLATSYGRTKVLFEDSYPAKMRRGIPLGDPLSEVILTMVLDVLLASMANFSGVYVGRSLWLNALVLGDEVLLFGTSSAQLHKALEVLRKTAFGVGLEVDPDKCLVSGAHCKPPKIVFGGKVLDQMLDGDYWHCFGRLFNGGRFLSPVKVLRLYTKEICEAELGIDELMSALKLMVNEYLDAEVFFTAPTVGELRSIDQEIFETACSILGQNDISWYNVFGIADEYCYGLTTVEERAPILLKKALEHLEAWRKYVRRNSLIDWCTLFVQNSIWCKQSWQLANLCDSEDFEDSEDSDFWRGLYF